MLKVKVKHCCYYIIRADEKILLHRSDGLVLGESVPGRQRFMLCCISRWGQGWESG